VVRTHFSSFFWFIFAKLFSLVLDHICTLKISFAPLSNIYYNCLLLVKLKLYAFFDFVVSKRKVKGSLCWSF